MEACLNCSRYIKCSDPKKSFNYICNRYKPVNRQEIQQELEYSNKKAPKNVDKLLDDPELANEFNIKRIVDQVLQDKSIVPVDVRMNDRDIPKAKNFFEFCTGEEFLDIKPFVEQCLIGTILNGEFCYRCSDIEWMLETHKVGDSLRRFEKRVALLENGDCPYCGATKSKLVKKEKINFYQELIAICGQRCVTGDTIVLHEGKRVRIDSFDNNFDYGFTPLIVSIYDGESYQETSHFLKALPEPIFKVTTARNKSIKGTNDHPLLTENGFVRIKNLCVGDTVLTHNGTSYTNDLITSIQRLPDEVTYDFTIPEVHCFWSNDFISSNSGKSAITAMLAAYHIHRIVKLSKPNEVYGLLHSNVFHINFVAMSFAGAKNLLYDPLYGYLVDAPWFQTYHAFLQNYERKTGEVVHKVNDTFLMYRHRALIVAPLGPDRRSLRGKTRIGAAIDEICHMPNDNTEAVKMNASEVYIALERSLLTIRSSANKLLAKGFNDIPTGMFWNISSPYSVRDKGMEVYRASQNSRKIYGVQKPTWEMNPTVTYEDLKSEFDKDPVTAMRDYGAQPPLQSNAFIQSNDHVSQLIGKKSNAIIYTMAQKRYKNGDCERYAQVKNIKEINYPSVLAIDAGVVNNSFSAVCAHYDEEEDTIVATTIVECIPFPGIPINFTLMYNNIICSIIESQNVVLLCADRWNSIKILSDARQQFNIEVEQYSLKYKDMWYVRDYITENRLILPKIEKTVEDCVEYDIDDYPYAFDGKPIEHLVLQMLTVRDTGSSVIKGDGNLTDDTFRALCLAVHRIRDEKHSLLFAGEYGEESERSNTQLAVVKGMSNTAVVGSISITGTSGKTIAVARRSRN